MIRSMTGFGSKLYEDNSIKLEIEIKSVNHRFFDCNIKLPAGASQLELKLRAKAKLALIRGSITIALKIFPQNAQVNISMLDRAKSYIELAEGLSKKYSIDNDITVANVISFLLNEKVDDTSITEEQEDLIFNIFDEAINLLNICREKEGNNLRLDFIDKLDLMCDIVTKMEKIYPQNVQEYKQHLEQDIFLMLRDDYKKERVLAEVALLADKRCIDEELVRLKSHIKQLKELLNSQEVEVGRRLDFIIQELNRESNTIVSKSSDLSIVGLGIELKSIIEKLREQAQNLL